MNKLAFIILLASSLTIYGQDSLRTKKTNYIIYAEFTIGSSPLGGYNPYVDTSINYQKKKHLF